MIKKAIGLVCVLAVPVLHAELSFEKSENRIRVNADGKLFTEFVYNTYAKPLFWPVVGPTGDEMTRNYPMKKGVDGEASDHPHHKSLLFHHGMISGENFWHEDGDKTGKVITEIDNVVLKQGKVIISSSNKWVGRKDKLVATDRSIHTIHIDGKGNRYIDFEVTMSPVGDDLVFGDTKEGSFAIRSHPELRLRGEVATAKAVNSAGDEGKSLWGKKAAWVNYFGTVNGKACGFAIFDHPDNLRYPTTWHARDYGLVAANPFGLSYFQKSGKGSGNHTIKSGDTITFKYRVVFHEGDHDAANIPGLFKDWAL